MTAVILAAGAGRRLGMSPPKSMIDVGGMSILQRQIRNFSEAGIERFVIVVGYRKDELLEHLSAVADRCTFVVNDRFAETNTLCSLHLALEAHSGSFVYANADVVFDGRLTDRLMRSDAAGAMCVRMGEVRPEDVKVVIENGRITRIGKMIDRTRAQGEFVGVARFSEATAAALRATLSDLIADPRATKAYFESAIHALCADHPIEAVDVTDLPWIEIDFPEDLERARREVVPLLEPPRRN